MNQKRFGAESLLIYRNESNRPANGLPAGGSAGEAAGKEGTIKTQGQDKYTHTIADVHLLHLNPGRNTPWDLCELDCWAFS